MKKISLSDAKSIQKELDVLHTLKGHSNIIELLACFLSDEEITLAPSTYLVFPFFETSRFSDYAGNITPQELAAYTQQLFSGLEYIHWRRIAY